MARMRLFAPLLAATVLAAPARAAAPATPVIAVAAVSGAVTVRTADGRVSGASAGQVLQPGTAVETRAGSSAVLAFSNGTKVRIEANSDFKLRENAGAATTLEILRGGLTAWVRRLERGARFRVRAPSAVASVRGTVLKAITNGRDSVFDLLSGEMALTDNFGRGVVMTSGQRVESQMTTGLGGVSSLPPGTTAPPEPDAPLPPSSGDAGKKGSGKKAGPKGDPASADAPEDLPASKDAVPPPPQTPLQNKEEGEKAKNVSPSAP